MSNWISCYWNVFRSKLFQVMANVGDMGLQECGQTILIFLNEAEGMDCKIILKCTLTDNVVPAALKYPSHNLFEVVCIICISYWKDRVAKKLDAMLLSVTAMKASLLCNTVSVSETGGDQFSLFEAWVCPKNRKCWKQTGIDRFRQKQKYVSTSYFTDREED